MDSGGSSPGLCKGLYLMFLYKLNTMLCGYSVENIVGEEKQKKR